MIFKNMKKSFQIFLILLISIPNIVSAYSDYLIVSGDNIGINIKTDGIMVVGTYDNKNSSQTLKKGDTILKINNEDVHTIDELTNVISLNGCKSINVTYKRNKEIKTTVLKLYEENNSCKTGLYVKDSITGIGTLTYIDPKTKIFGALGHEIIEKTTGSLVETKKGTIFTSEVIDINRSSIGKPGEKTARYYSNEVNGYVYENTNKGIFGLYSKQVQAFLYSLISPKILGSNPFSLLQSNKYSIVHHTRTKDKTYHKQKESYHEHPISEEKKNQNSNHFQRLYWLP